MEDEWKNCFLTPPRFENTAAYALLKELATKAPCLNKMHCITEERITALRAVGAGYTVLYGFQRVDAQIMKALADLCQERMVLSQMKMLFSGEKINWIEGFSSENRSVLHPATRDIFEEALTGNVTARQAASAEVSKLQVFFGPNKVPFRHLIFVGIGGSELGPHAIADALEPYYLPGRSVSYIANVDPDEMSLVLAKVDLKQTLVAIVSKSGTTLETETNEERLRDSFAKAGCTVRDHFLAITCPNTPMDDEKKYAKVFYLFDWVGGRYSATSMVGGVLISFLCGTNTFIEFLKGANAMDQVALRKELHENLPMLLASISVFNRNFLKYQTQAIIPYSYGLRRFPAHLQQCSMESNGKGIDRLGQKVLFETGAVFWGEPGTNAQHSFFQLLHQGTDTIPVDFIGFKESQIDKDFSFHGTTSHEKLLANMFAQAISLAVGKDSENPNKYFPGNRPSTIILGVKLDPFSLGSLLSLYENSIVYQGFIWGINSFDQEGVQLGKTLAHDILKIIQDRKAGGEDFAANPVARRLLDLLDDVGHTV